MLQLTVIAQAFTVPIPPMFTSVWPPPLPSIEIFFGVPPGWCIDIPNVRFAVVRLQPAKYGL